MNTNIHKYKNVSITARFREECPLGVCLSRYRRYGITFPGQSLSKTLEEAMDLSQDRLILELEQSSDQVTSWFKA
jgi:hypothetical protein